MTEKSYFWAGTSIGHASLAPYTDDDFSDMLAGLLNTYRYQEGVFLRSDPLYSQYALAVVAGLGSTVQVYSGYALVDGKLYLNDGTINISLSTWSTYYIVGLRKDFTAQTVEVFSRSGYASHATALASLVHTEGVTWEIPLGTVYVSGVGAVTVQDARRFMKSPIVPHRYKTGSSGSLVTPGSSEFAGKPSVIYQGCEEIAFTPAATTATKTITLDTPVILSGTPAVLLTMTDADAALGVCQLVYDASSSSSTSLVINATSSSAAGASDSIKFVWVAIGWLY